MHDIIATDASSSPRGTTRASALRAKIAEATAEDVLSAAVDAEYDQASFELALREQRIKDLEAEIPSPPVCFEDLIARAEIAFHGGDVQDGKLVEAEDEDLFTGPAGRLVEAVLQFGGVKAGPLVMSPANAAHFRVWRAMIEAHVAEFEHVNDEGKSEAQIKDEEARCEASMDEIDAVAEAILAEPVKTWGDLLPCAQVVCWRHWPGIDPEGPDAREQMDAGSMGSGDLVDEAVAALLRGIFTLAGVGLFKEAAP